MPSTLRFAAGTPDAPVSSLWHLAVTGSDVYLGQSARSMGQFKWSFHASGTWIFGGTAESGVTFERGNRRAKQWARPAEHMPGWTRGPGIAVPHMPGPARPPVVTGKEVVWVPGPAPGSALEFSLYFAAPDASEPNWDPSHQVVGERGLRDGGRVVVTSSYRRMTAKFEANVEWMVASTVVGADPAGITENALLWITESRGKMVVPLVVDLLATVALNNPSAVIAAADPLEVRPNAPSTLDEWRSGLTRDHGR